MSALSPTSRLVELYDQALAITSEWDDGVAAPLLTWRTEFDGKRFLDAEDASEQLGGTIDNIASNLTVDGDRIRANAECRADLDYAGECDADATALRAIQRTVQIETAFIKAHVETLASCGVELARAA